MKKAEDEQGQDLDPTLVKISPEFDIQQQQQEQQKNNLLGQKFLCPRNKS